MNKFNKGDKVRRTTDNFNLCVVGHIYTVQSCHNTSLRLMEVDGGYDAQYYELVKTVNLPEDLFTL